MLWNYWKASSMTRLPNKKKMFLRNSMWFSLSVVDRLSFIWSKLKLFLFFHIIGIWLLKIYFSVKVQNYAVKEIFWKSLEDWLFFGLVLTSLVYPLGKWQMNENNFKIHHYYFCKTVKMERSLLSYYFLTILYSSLVPGKKWINCSDEKENFWKTEFGKHLSQNYPPIYQAGFTGICKSFPLLSSTAGCWILLQLYPQVFLQY